MLFSERLLIYLRQPMYLLFSLAMPVVSFLLFGMMFRNTDYAGVDFFSMFIPGFCMLILFSSGVSNIGNQIVADKEKGIYKRIMVTPIKLRRFIGTILFKNFLLAAFGFLLILLVAALVFHVQIGAEKLPFVIAYFVFILFALSVGVGIAFVSNRINTYSIVMMVMFMPMFMLSDAAVPLMSYPEIARKIAEANPLYHANKILRFFWSEQMRELYQANIWISFAFLGAICVLIYCIVFLNRRKLYERRS